MSPNESGGQGGGDDRFVFAGLIVALVFAPVAFGSVHVWAYSLVELMVFTFVFLFFAARIFSKGEKTIELVRTPVDLLILLFFALVVFQVVPIPEWLLSLVSPETYRDKFELRQFFEGFTQSHGIEYSADFLAYYRHPVYVESLKAAAYAGMFFLVLNTARSKRRLDILIYALILIGLFEAIYGLFQAFGKNHSVLWFTRPGYRYASGTYIVSNHFAFYMEMAFSVTFGLLIAQTGSRKSFAGGLKTARARFQAFIHWFSPESSSPKRMFFFFVAVMIGTGLLMSASRGGIVSMAVAMMAGSILFLFKKRLRKTSAVSIFLCVAALLSAGYTGMDRTVDKFEFFETSFGQRFCYSENMVPMLMDYPVLGVGWGNFRYVYPQYQSPDCDVLATSGFSHNDWLEAGTDTGFAGLALIVFMVAVLFYRIHAVWRKRRSNYALGIGAGAMVCMVAACFHSVGDLNMRIPTNPLTLAAVLAIGFAAVHMKDKGYEQTFFYRKRKIVLGAAGSVVFGLVLVAGYGAAVWHVACHFLAEANCPTEWNGTLNLDLSPEKSEILKAVDHNPRNAVHYRKLAMHYIREETDDVERKRQNVEKAVDALLKSLVLDPTKAAGWYNLGVQFLRKDYDVADFYEKWVPLADRCFDFVLEYEPNNAEIVLKIAKYWVWRAKRMEKESESVQENALRAGYRAPGVEKFQGLFKRGLAIEPGGWKDAVERVWKFYPEDSIVLGIVPANNHELEKKILKWLAAR